MMKKYIIVILIISFFIGATFLPQDWGSEEKILFQIKKGQSFSEIAGNMQKQKIIDFSTPFRIYAFFSGKTGKLQAGCYFLSPSMSIRKIAEIFSAGKVAKEKITFPEGFTSEQIYQKLQTMNLTGSDPARLAESEGYLFPDTYEIAYCQEQEKVIEMMTANFNSKTAELRMTPEAVVMASLLEKELKTKEEKEIASGILWKRIKFGMPLQVDAHMWTYDNLRLPPKPIANPGLESIEAALHPEESPYWYYLSTPDGKTVFSRTLEEHNIAKVKYLK